jgi:hypothetical protein
MLLMAKYGAISIVGAGLLAVCVFWTSRNTVHFAKDLHPDSWLVGQPILAAAGLPPTFAGATPCASS